MRPRELIVRIAVASMLITLLGCALAEAQVAIKSPPDGSVLRGQAAILAGVPNPGQGCVTYRVLDAQGEQKLLAGVAPPYELRWDTRARNEKGERLYADGEYTVEAKALDGAGKALGAAQVKVKVENDIPASEAAGGINLGMRLKRAWQGTVEGLGKTKFIMEPFNEAAIDKILLLNALLDIRWSEHCLAGSGTGGGDVRKSVEDGKIVYRGFEKAAGGMAGGMGMMGGAEAGMGPGMDMMAMYGMEAEGGGAEAGMGMMGGGGTGGKLKTRAQAVPGVGRNVMLRVSPRGTIELKKRKHRDINLVENYISFPDRTLKIGDTWTSEMAVLPCVAGDERVILTGKHTLEGLEVFGKWKCARIKSVFGQKDVELAVSVDKYTAKTSYNGERRTYFAYEEGIVVGMEDRVVHDLNIDLSKAGGVAGGVGGMAGGMMGGMMGGMPGEAGMMPGMGEGMPGAMSAPMGMMGGSAAGMGMGMGGGTVQEITGTYTVTYDTRLVE